MSVENLKKYGHMCAEVEKARDRAKEIGLQDIDGQIAHAKSLGLEFSREDFEALAKEIGLEKKDDLSDEELEKVAGGVSWDPYWDIEVKAGDLPLLPSPPTWPFEVWQSLIQRRTGA
jgi:hypothetical protein